MDDQILGMIDQIRDAGFDGVGGLLAAIMDSSNEQIKRRLNRLIMSESGHRFVCLSMQRRKQDLPDEILDVLVTKMTAEAEAIRKDKACHIGSKGVSPEYIKAFRFQSVGLRFAELAPCLWRMICDLGDVDRKTANEYLRNPPDDFDMDDLDNERPDGADGPEAPPSAQAPKKMVKAKVLAAIMAIAQIVFTRSRNCNGVQMMIGYYLFSTRTGKRVMGVLNHLGISTSYETVRLALKGNADKVFASITKRVRREPFALTYDNLTNKHHAATETLLNKSSMQCFTAAGIIFLTLTPSLARTLGKTPEVLAPDRALPGESRQSHRARIRHRSTPPDDKPGLRADLLFHANPDWASLTPDDIANIDADQDYFGPIAKALISRVLKKFFPREMKQSEDEAKIAPIAMPQLYKIQARASDMHTLATLEVDESTIDGNLIVLESLTTGQLGLTLEELADGRIIPVSGDQMTVTRITSGQFLRTRDFNEHRMLWAKTLSGMLHTRMAMIHAIYLSHSGRPDGRDPASLSKFVKLLGRTKIREGCPNLNASQELLTQVCEGHILAALIERTKAGSMNGLRSKVATGQWKDAVESLVDEWLQLDSVEHLREDARDEAQMEVVTNDGAPLSGETAKQTETRIKKAIAKAEMSKRDVVFENALLLMVQALLYTDYHNAIRSGDTGRLERSSDILCVMFQGLSKLKNYRALSLDFKASRVKEWTENMRELWL
jgi:hypothetical protein